MNRRDDSEILLEALVGLADYYRAELSEATLQLYLAGLSDLPVNDVKKAITSYVMATDDKNSFMPRISDIRQRIAGRTSDRAGVAWAKVDAAVRMVGSYQDVVFDDPIIHRVISDLGGWIWLGQQSEKEWAFIANRFQQAYRGYALLAEMPEFPPVLTGIANAQNQLIGQSVNKSVLIGNEERAKHVQITGKPGSALQIARTETRPKMEVLSA